MSGEPSGYSGPEGPIAPTPQGQPSGSADMDVPRGAADVDVGGQRTA